jgi:hypothetical protein
VSLHPTPTRVALLGDVADGLVVSEGTTIWLDERLAYLYDPHAATRTRVTSRVNELVRADWVARDNDGTYRLTAAGQDTLADGVR